MAAVEQPRLDPHCHLPQEQPNQDLPLKPLDPQTAGTKLIAHMTWSFFA